MAQLVIAAAGAAIGGYLAPGAVLLGLSGAQLGWMAGSMLGSALGPRNHQSGPRLDELRITGTEYGGGIAWVAGAPRVAGDLIWAADRREIATTEEVGKGGGGSSYTTYTYETDALYLLADQPGCIVTRIWDNGKLVWTNLASADDASRIASEQQDRWRRLTVYDGSDSQLPDPVYDAAVTNAPAYTRRLTVFIEGLQLGSSGTLPNLTFEVASNGDTNPNFSTRYQVADTGRQFAAVGSPGLGLPGILAMQPSVRVAIQHDTSTTVYVFSLQGEDEGTDVRTTDENFPSVVGVGAGIINFPVGMLDGQPVRCANHFYALGTDTHIRCGASLASAWGTGVLPDLADALPAGRYMGDTLPCSDGVHLLVMTAPSQTYFGATVVDAWHIIRRDEDGLPVLVRSGSIEDARSLFCYGNCAQQGYTYSAGMLEDDLQHVWYAYGAGTGYVEMLKIGADDVMRQRSLVNDSLAEYSFTYPSLWAEGGFCVVVSRESYQAFRRVGDVIGEVPLQSVVEALCSRATMPAGTYDASALADITQPVRALAITNGSVRQALEILQTSHGFDTHCTDKLYFVPRGGAALLTVDADDLAAGEGDAAEQSFAPIINADLEMPSRIAVVFRNMLADQINGAEHSDRGPALQDSIQTLQLAIGLTPAEAKGVADATVRDAWAARLSATISLPIGYAAITPTDVVQVPGTDGALYRMRVTRRTDSGGIITLDVVGDDGAVVIDEMATDEEYVAQTAVETLATTELALLDIPLLRDADDSPGMYLAVRGSTNRWPGCIVYRSNDGSTFTESVADISEPAVIGETTSALQDWSGGAIWDRGSSVLVDVGPGQMSSATADQLQADADLNALLIGAELVRFTTATLQSTAPNVYRVSGLMRGLRGTSSTGHAIGEAVVLLRSRGMRRIALAQADIGALRYFKAVTKGGLLADAQSVSITPANRSQRMLAPVDLRALRDADGNMTLTWKRRTRYESRLTGPSGAVVPLDAQTEAYDVEILNGTSVVRSARVTEASMAYTATQQISDFGGIQGVVTARVYQVGASGRGQALTASAGGAAGAALVRTITLGGIFTTGLTISVRAGNSLLAAHTVQSADTDLDGVATALAAAINGGGTGYTAASLAGVVTVTGPLGVQYSLVVDVSGASSIESERVQTSAMASAGSPYRVRLGVGARFAWGAGGTVDAGTLLSFTLRINGTDLPAVEHLVSYAQSAQQALVGLQYAFSGSAINAAGYSIVGNTDIAGYHLILTRLTVGYINAAVVDRSTGGFFISSTLSSVADQGVDPVLADRPQIYDLVIYGTPAAGEVYSVTLTPTPAVTMTPQTYSYTALAGDDAEDVATGLAAAVDAGANYIAAASDRGLGGPANTVRITGALTIPFEGGVWTVQPSISRAITAVVA